MAQRFEIAWTADFLNPTGAPRYADVGEAILREEAGLTSRIIGDFNTELTSAQVAGSQGVVVLGPRVTSATVAKAHDLLAIGRFGVGYDSVDVAACTQADVMLFIAAGAVDRSVAEAIIAWMLALSHHVRAKDQLVRTGDWSGRSSRMGRELRGRRLGVIGLGGIGRELVRLLGGFGMLGPVAYDPCLDPRIAAECGVELASLQTVMSTADFVSINCPLNESTRGLVGARELSWMRRDAYLINTARGGIVDENALYEALKENRLAGAGTDVFAEEPITVPPRLAELDNVILAPHCIAWTDELFRDIGRSVCTGMRELARGRVPAGVVNPEVLDRAGFREKWARLGIAAG